MENGNGKWNPGKTGGKTQGPFDNMKTDLCSLLLTMFIKKLLCAEKRKEGKHKEFSRPLDIRL